MQPESDNADLHLYGRSGSGQAPVTDEAAEGTDQDATRAPSKPKPATTTAEATGRRNKAKPNQAQRRARRARIDESIQIELPFFGGNNWEVLPDQCKPTTDDDDDPNEGSTTAPKESDRLHGRDPVDSSCRVTARQVAATSSRFSRQLATATSDTGIERDATAAADVLVCTTDDGDSELLLGEWEDIEIEVTLDSGCCDHVLDSCDAPGYDIAESPGSRRNQNFIVGNGARVPNEGQVLLNLEASVDGKPSLVRSIFQVAEISRPLMSVSRMCDQGLMASFTDKDATIKNGDGTTVCTFQRRGGLYVTTMKLKKPAEHPEPFARPGQ